MTMTAKNNGLVGFSTRSYPRFGRSKYDNENPPTTVVKSPYFWWYKFLQLNSDYQQTIKANGSGKLADIYADLGDLSAVDFKSWWNEKKYYFAEPQAKYRMLIANSAADLAPFNSNEVINLVVPLMWTQRSLKKKFSSLVLKQVEKSKRGVSVEASKAKYRISGKWNIDALQNAYKVYVIRNTLVDGKKLAFADVAIKASLDIAKDLELGKKTNFTSDARKVATIVAMRHYKRAEEFIKNAPTRSFPYAL
jgi:hypothetical protein